MNISYSELIVLNNDVMENVKAMSECGSDHIEVLMDAAGWEAQHGNYSPIAKKLKETGLKFSVHPAAWDINLTAEMEILRKAAYDHHIAALQFSAELGASQMVVHPGFAYSPCFNKETARERAHETICRLAEEAKKYGVKLAFENVGYNGASIYTEEEYCHALDDVDPIVQYLIDIGHANVNKWNIPSVIEKLGNRMCGLHIHDNNGRTDGHCPIGLGCVEWEPIYEAMKKITTPECEFILEYAPGFNLKYLTEGRDILIEKLG